MTHEASASRKIVRLLSVAVMVCVSGWAAPILTLNPSGGVISGNAGATIGWGFTITNATDFLEVTSSQFCLNPVSTPFCTVSTLGTYTDIISSEPNPVIVGSSPESTSITQTFDEVTQAGIGSFEILTNAANGSTDSGEIVLTYDLFSVSPNAPNFDPTADTISTDNFLTASAGIAVNPVATPEPAPFAYEAAGLMALGCFVWRVKRRASLD